MCRLMLLLLSIGCNGAVGGDTDSPPSPASHSDQCGGNEPIIDEIEISNYGLTVFGEGPNAKEWPAILIDVSATDEDGDLDNYTMKVWFDSYPDGSVAITGDPLKSAATVSEDDCAVPDATLGMVIAVNGNPPAATELEFGVVIVDAEGHQSNEGVPELVVFVTPDEDGNDV